PLPPAPPHVPFAALSVPGARPAPAGRGLRPPVRAARGRGPPTGRNRPAPPAVMPACRRPRRAATTATPVDRAPAAGKGGPGTGSGCHALGAPRGSRPALPGLGRDLGARPQHGADRRLELRRPVPCGLDGQARRPPGGAPARSPPRAVVAGLRPACDDALVFEPC